MAYYTDEQIEVALAKLRENDGRVTKTIRELGYPKRSTLYRWLSGERSPATSRKTGGSGDRYSEEERAEALRLVSEGLSYAEAARRVGASSGAVVYHWANGKRRYLEGKARMAVESSGEERAYDGFEGSLEERIRLLELENDILRGAVELLKAGSLDEMSNMEKTVLINKLRLESDRPLRELTGSLRISKSSYEYWRAKLAAPDKYEALRGEIREIFDGSDGTRGYRYVHHELRERGTAVSEKVVRRLMAEEGCKVIYLKRARHYSSYEGETSEAPPNLVNRDFHADAPNKLWLTDITEFSLPCGKCYLSPILDCYDGKVVSWSIGSRPTAELANSSLLAACETLGPGQSPVCHSDRGGHYRWPGWIGICEENGIVRSMSKKGCSPDNSACEGFFGRLKNEFFYHRDWRGVSMREFMERLDGFIGFYNEERVKESLGWMSPNQYRRSKGLAA